MKKILLQFDTDVHPSSFDRVVAADAGVDEQFSYGAVTPETVTGLVHGAIFTRGPSDLKHTAIFIGGSDVQAGEALMKKVQSTFFGPMRVSVMMDSNGCNTTAAAAVVAAGKHVELKGLRSIVLGATGPVGQRVVQLLAAEGGHVTAVSRSQDRADQLCKEISSENGQLIPAGASSSADILALCRDQELVVAAGAAGVCLLETGGLGQLDHCRVAVDLNAVPPLGLADVGVSDRAKEVNGTTCYGALGVGGTKMKVHKQAIAKLFEENDRVFDTKEIYQLALASHGS